MVHVEDVGCSCRY